MTTLTPTQIIADLKALDIIERDWLLEGRLDSAAEDDIKDKRSDLWDSLREQVNTGFDDVWLEWYAYVGDMDYVGYREIPATRHLGDNLQPQIGTGKTEIEAIEELLDLIGETA